MAFLMASLRRNDRGTPGINRPIGVQVAGNSNGNYVERRAVEASVAFGLSGGKLTLAPGLSSRARPNSSSAFDSKNRPTGIAGGRRHRQIGNLQGVLRNTPFAD
ncbi:hypothetical protein [Ensifer sp. YR511]|uniref:hypothetical protein n=1 Tax=Ensifer sp. YR511 TaxID=1855294 RepID=UPI00088DFE01|nr:hypothetical protein [Ensifer sp. YR511]SDO02829.1 hypothetical protein SAMN05216328_14918 [Ensifer sp. YR511]